MDMLPTELHPPEPDGPIQDNVLRHLDGNPESWEQAFDRAEGERPSYLSTRRRQTFYHRPAYRPLYGGAPEAVPVRLVSLEQIARECKLVLKDGRVG